MIMEEFEMVDTAFVLVGGLGTRLGELTREVPKPMIEINGVPLLELQLGWYESFGIKKVVLGMGHKSHVITDYFNKKDLGLKLIFSIEAEPLGTAGALKLAGKHLPDEFLFANGDLLTCFNLLDMIKQHHETDAVVTTALKKKQGDLSRFGTVEMQGLKIKRFVEKTSHPPSNLIHAGISIMKKEVLGLIPEGKCSVEKEVYPKLAEQGKQYGYVINGAWVDVGIPGDLELARRIW